MCSALRRFGDKTVFVNNENYLHFRRGRYVVVNCWTIETVVTASLLRAVPSVWCAGSVKRAGVNCRNRVRWRAFYGQSAAPSATTKYAPPPADDVRVLSRRAAAVAWPRRVRTSFTLHGRDEDTSGFPRLAKRSRTELNLFQFNETGSLRWNGP